MKIIAFVREREEVIRILRHLKMWPIEYPKPCAIDARTSPFPIHLLVNCPIKKDVPCFWYRSIHFPEDTPA